MASGGIPITIRRMDTEEPQLVNMAEPFINMAQNKFGFMGADRKMKWYPRVDKFTKDWVLNRGQSISGKSAATVLLSHVNTTPYSVDFNNPRAILFRSLYTGVVIGAVTEDGLQLNGSFSGANASVIGMDRFNYANSIVTLNAFASSARYSLAASMPPFVSGAGAASAMIAPSVRAFRKATFTGTVTEMRMASNVEYAGLNAGYTYGRPIKVDCAATSTKQGLMFQSRMATIFAGSNIFIRSYGTAGSSFTANIYKNRSTFLQNLTINHAVTGWKTTKFEFPLTWLVGGAQLGIGGAVVNNVYAGMMFVEYTDFSAGVFYLHSPSLIQTGNVGSIASDDTISLLPPSHEAAYAKTVSASFIVYTKGNEPQRVMFPMPFMSKMRTNGAAAVLSNHAPFIDAVNSASGNPVTVTNRSFDGVTIEIPANPTGFEDRVKLVLSAQPEVNAIA
jgi:hypothetical protein